MTEYDQKAVDFLKSTGTVICKEFIGMKKHSEDDKARRNVWKITIKRRCSPFEGDDSDGEERSWSFDYGDSIYNTYNDIVQMSAKDSGGYGQLPIDMVVRNKSAMETMRESTRAFSFTLNGREVRFLKRNRAQHMPPSDYSILACISSDSYCDYNDEYEFGEEMGYEIHSWNDYRKVRDIYQECREAARMCQFMFGDVMEQLREIQ